MKKIIINGANGYVASNFIKKLLANNYKVIALVRDSAKRSAKDKMYDALSKLDTDFSKRNLTVYPYSLLDENFALTKELLTEIFEGDVDYFHFAASLKYDLKSKDEIFTTNIDGVKNSLKIFKDNASTESRFFFISTAYSCGKFNGAFMEKFYDNEDISSFRNYYEQSKRFAENVIREFKDDNSINAHIIRLSQVVGDSRTGVTLTDYGVFDFAKRLYGLSVKYPNQTVRIKVDPDSTQNLIPINLVIRYLMRTIEVVDLPEILNLVSKVSIKNLHIINSLCELLPVNIVPVEKLERDEMTPLERIISVGMSFTGEYVKTDLSFDTTNLDKIVLHTDHEINEDAIYKMLEYFVSDLDAKHNKKAI